MSEFNTIPNLNWIPIKVPQNVQNFIKALESSTELIDNVNVFQYETDEPRIIYTDFTIEVQDYGEYLIELVLDIDEENPGHTHIQFTEIYEDSPYKDPVEFTVSSNLENYCDSLDEAKRFINKLLKQVKLEVIEFLEN